MKDPNHSKRRRLWKLFRITLEEQQAIDEYQFRTSPYKLLMGSCLGTDHNHKDGLIRGRIDFRLNRALGIIESFGNENSPAILRALAHYLEVPPAVTVIGKRYGLIGEAKIDKKKPIYGSANGPVEHKKRRRKRRAR